MKKKDTSIPNGTTERNSYIRKILVSERNHVKNPNITKTFDIKHILIKAKNKLIKEIFQNYNHDKDKRY